MSFGRAAGLYPKVSTREPPSELGGIVLAIGGPIRRAHLPDLCERVRVLLHGKDAGVVVCALGDGIDPDAVAVDALCRLHLTIKRLGHRLRILDICEELEDLLALMGLSEVLSVELGVEPRGEAEEREQRLGVQEEADRADPAL
jgi:ABC-type transporter Mla MlaB component